MKKETAEKDGCSALVVEIAIAIGVVIISCIMNKKEERR